MREVTYKIPDDSTKLVTELVEKLGGFVEKKAEQAIKQKINKKKNTGQKMISPTFLFGKWKDLDLDPITYRDKLWPRKEL